MRNAATEAVNHLSFLFFEQPQLFVLCSVCVCACVCVRVYLPVCHKRVKCARENVNELILSLIECGAKCVR